MNNMEVDWSRIRGLPAGATRELAVDRPQSGHVLPATEEKATARQGQQIQAWVRLICGLPCGCEVTDVDEPGEERFLLHGGGVGRVDRQ